MVMETEAFPPVRRFHKACVPYVFWNTLYCYSKISKTNLRDMVKPSHIAIQFLCCNSNALDTVKLVVRVHVKKNHVQHCGQYTNM